MDPRPVSHLEYTPTDLQLATITDLDDYRARRATSRLSSTSTQPADRRLELITLLQTVDDDTGSTA